MALLFVADGMAPSDLCLCVGGCKGTFCGLGRGEVCVCCRMLLLLVLGLWLRVGVDVSSGGGRGDFDRERERLNRKPWLSGWVFEDGDVLFGESVRVELR